MDKKILKNVYIALLVSIGLVLQIIETSIPVPVNLPGAKLGLANITSLLTLVLYGPATAIWVSAVRAVLGGIIASGVSAIPYSFNGAILSTVVMWYAMKYLSPKVSLIGVSVLGAAGHNVAQIFTAAAILGNMSLLTYLPVLLIIGTITGYFIGLACSLTVNILKADIDKYKGHGRNTL